MSVSFSNTLFALVAAVLAGGVYSKLDVVDSLNQGAYAGRWYQTHTSLYPYETFERNGYCITADYEVMTAEDCNGAVPGSDLCFALVNTANHGAPDGPTRGGEGIAYGNSEAPGKLNVYMDGQSTFASLYSYYWIAAVSPIDAATGQYQWAVISDPNKLYLFVLARDATQFKVLYEDDVLDLVKDLGFDTFWNKPIETYQQADCVYSPEPAASQSAFVRTLVGSSSGVQLDVQGQQQQQQWAAEQSGIHPDRVAAAFGHFARRHQLALPVSVSPALQLLPTPNAAAAAEGEHQELFEEMAPMHKAMRLRQPEQQPEQQQQQQRVSKDIPFVESHHHPHSSSTSASSDSSASSSSSSSSRLSSLAHTIVGWFAPSSTGVAMAEAACVPGEWSCAAEQ
jgi:apolipoprotein D and lipocalin family protein